jgi:hypothetical protein
MKKFIFISVLLLLTPFISRSQKLTCHPGNKISNRNYQYLIGFKGDNTFLLASKQDIYQDVFGGVNNGRLHWEKKNEVNLLRYNSNFELTLQADIAFTSKPEIYFGSFINKDLLQFIYSGIIDKKYTCIVDQFDVNGRFIGTKNMGPGLDNYQGSADIIKYYHTDDFLINCIIVKDKIIFFDKNLNEIWTENILSDKILDAEFSQEDGILFITGMKNTSFILYKYDPLNKTKSENSINLKKEVLKDLSIHFYPEKTEVVIFSLFQPQEKKVDFPVKGIQINRIDANTLTGKKEIFYNISEQTLLEMSTKKSVDKSAGGNEINIAGFYVSNENEITLALEKKYKIEIIPKGIPEYEMHYEDILLMKCYANGISTEYIIKRDVADLLKNEHYLVSKLLPYKDQLFLLYYQKETAKNRPILNISKLNSDLHITTSEKADTYLLNNTYLNIRSLIPIGPGRYFIPAYNNAVFGSAYLDFK